jgi:hypothetical protein
MSHLAAVAVRRRRFGIGVPILVPVLSVLPGLPVSGRGVDNDAQRNPPVKF